MTIRSFEPEDKEAILHLFDANTPAFFAFEERDDLIFYLEKEIENYFVVEVGHTIVASGGYNRGLEPGALRISWDLVHPDHQGKGYGSELLKFRIQKIKDENSVPSITVRTSQMVYTFYEKHHFILQKIVKDYWADGYDLYDMLYDKTA